MNSVTLQRNISGAGKTLSDSVVLSIDRVAAINDTLPAAYAGAMGGTSGHITFATSNFSTSDKIDVYWNGGSRFGVTVSGITGTDYTVTGGSGDALPAASTVVAAMKPVEVDFSVTGFVGGDTLALIACQLQKVGRIAFFESTTQTNFDFPKNGTWPAANTTYAWSTQLPPGDQDPFTAASISPTGFTVSHGDATATCDYTILIGADG